MRKSLFCLALLFSTPQIFSQTRSPQADSLLRVVEKLPDDTAKIRTIYKHANFLLRFGLPDNLLFLKNGQQLAQKLGSTAWQPEFEMQIGRNHANQNRPDSALFYFARAQAGFQKLGNLRGEASVLSKIRWVHNFLGDFEKANQFALAALAMYEKLGDEAGIATALGQLGEVLYAQKRFSESVEQFQKAYDLKRKLGRPAEIAIAAQGLGHALLGAGDAQKSLDLQNEALKINRELGVTIEIATVLNMRGNALKYLKRYPEALADYQESLKLARQIGVSPLEWSCKANIGNVYNLLGDYRKALPFLLAVQQQYEKSRRLEHSVENLHHIARAYEGIGKFDSAYFFKEKQLILSDSLLNRDNQKAMNELQTKYETAQKENQIAEQTAEISKKQQAIWLIAGILALVLVSSIFLFYQNRLRQKLEHQETLRLREMDDFKTRFFTNISHEFRTPLTVILGMSERLLNDQSINNQSTNQPLTMIKRNGENLLRLINQILDLAKLESNSLKINYVQGDVLTYLRYIVESLHSLAEAQNVVLQVESEQPKIVMDYDPERLLQIVHNLLSNAIKFTPAGGKIVLEINPTSDKSQLSLLVKDTGAGIPAADLPHIFDRFYQAKNSEKANSGGAGIGLALTRELVRTMNGEISAESRLGKGSIFTVTLPISNQADFENLTNRAVIEISKTPATESQILEKSNLSAASNLPETTPLVLLIEDNADVVEYLAACLKEKYRLAFALNGRAGIEKALEIVPDLIISDVMMPEKDGLEVCDFLKNDERTSHIPLILLTAKATVEDRIAGLRRGADAYLSKPFREEELLVWVEQLIAQRRNLQARYAKISVENELKPAAAAPPELVLEDAFIQKFRGILEDNFSDPEFSTETICRKIGMSRAQLYRKISALTNRPVNEHISQFRLEKARQLLRNGGMNISEIAFAVGFNDPKYFSRVFSEVFGAAPSEFLAKS